MMTDDMHGDGGTVGRRIRVKLPASTLEAMFDVMQTAEMYTLCIDTRMQSGR